MPADWIIKQGDTQPVFADRLQYSDGTVPPLRNSTIVLRVRSLTDASLATLTGTVTLLDPNTGDIVFSPSSADSSTPGNFFSEWVVTFDPSTGLGQQTFPTDGYNWLFVEPNLALAPQQLVDISLVKRYLNIQGNDRVRDAELMSLASDAAALVEADVGPVVPKQYEEWHDGGSNVIALNRDPSFGFGSNPYVKVIAASEYRGPIEYPLALVPSPTFGSIYSIMVVPDRASVTRRTAGGRTIAFMPGRESVHIWYESGQVPIPGIIQRAALEYIRNVYRWPQQTGVGSLAPADRMEAGVMLQQELSRITRMWLKPLRRFPSIA